MTETNSLFRARKQFEAIRGFYIHFMVFVPVVLLIAALDAMRSGTDAWPFVALGWGIGVVFHGYAAFVATPRRLAQWERDKSQGNQSPAA